MIFKFTNIDHIIVNIPNSEFWEIRFRSFDDEGYDDCGIYLIYNDKEIEVRDHYVWTQGRPQLSCYAVGELYKEIVDVICQQIANNPNLTLIDIDSIEVELVDKKYEKIWLDNNYIKVYNDGSW